mgnify:CR=1 FL=1
MAINNLAVEANARRYQWLSDPANAESTKSIMELPHDQWNDKIDALIDLEYPTTSNLVLRTNNQEPHVFWGEAETAWSHDMLRVPFEQWMHWEYTVPDIDFSAKDYSSYQTRCLYHGFLEGAWFMEHYKTAMREKYEEMASDFNWFKDNLINAASYLSDAGREQHAAAVEKALEILSIEFSEKQPLAQNLKSYNSTFSELIERAINDVLWARSASYMNKQLLIDKITTTVLSPHSNWVIMPLSLTHANGAKHAMSGEYHIERTFTCTECEEIEEGDVCEICDDTGEFTQRTTVPWDMIKDIYSDAVSKFALRN